MTRAAALILTAALAALLAAPASRAQVVLDENPAEALGAKLEEKRGAEIPLDLAFTAPSGETVRLGDYFDGERPVVLVLGYYDCPLLCPWVFSSMQGAFNKLAWRVGDEYRALAVSIDPTNDARQATEQRKAAVAGLRREPAEDGWDFLLSSDDNAEKLADAVGFRYAYLEESGEYAHPGVAIIVSPEGVVTQYLQVSPLPEKQLRLSLMDAADGKIGGFIDKFVFACHVYDPDAGSFVLHARTVMNIAAVATAVLLAAVVGALLLAERRKRRNAAAPNDDVPGAVPNPAH